jgi:hypothetical protein
MTNLGTPKLWSLLTGCSEVAYIIKLKLGLENGDLCRQVVVKSGLTEYVISGLASSLKNLPKIEIIENIDKLELTF